MLEVWRVLRPTWQGLQVVGGLPAPLPQDGKDHADLVAGCEKMLAFNHESQQAAHGPNVHCRCDVCRWRAQEHFGCSVLKGSHHDTVLLQVSSRSPASAAGCRPGQGATKICQSNPNSGERSQ